MGTYKNKRPILVVEDEPDGQELVSRILSQLNIPVEVAGNAEDAWEMLTTRAYTAAVIDLALPGRDGLTLVGDIRAAGSNMPCIAMTAFHTPELKQKALADGFNAYFAKPIDHNRFLSEVDRVMLG